MLRFNRNNLTSSFHIFCLKFVSFDIQFHASEHFFFYISGTAIRIEQNIKSKKNLKQKI